MSRDDAARRTHLRFFLFRLCLAGVFYSAAHGPSAIKAAAPNINVNGAAAPATVDLVNGRKLFERVWLPGDESKKSDDGLGPFFNERSCVACHSHGGIGGGGPNEKNVELLTVAVP